MSRPNALFAFALMVAAGGLAAAASAADPVEKKDESTQLKTYSVGGTKTTPKAATTVAPVEKPKFDAGLGIEKPMMDMTPFTVTPVVATPVAPVAGSGAAHPAPKNAPSAKPSSSGTTASGSGALPAAQAAAARGTPPVAGALPQAQTATAPALVLVALSTPSPDYPREAALAGTQGFVVVEFTINSEGSTQDINVVEASPQRVFDTAARRAVSRWKFQPVLENGNPVTKRVQRRIDFKL